MTIDDGAGKFARLDNARLKTIAALAGIGGKTRLELNQKNRITRNG
jgi:hypothetical protein